MKKWIQKKQVGTYSKKDTPVDMIAKMRGIQDPDTFLHPSKDELCDPYLLKNIEEACQRIAKAINLDERVIVSYDPDADGLTSASIMIRALRRYGVDVDFIYGERGDGHGIANMMEIKPINVDGNELPNARHYLNMKNIEKIKNCDLLILVDSSSNDVEVCGRIANAGIDIIILDHHGIEQHNPHVIMVNPQQKGCRYPNKQLSGAGIVFKTLQVLMDYVETDEVVNPFDYIDLVAVGMYSDIMRVDILENRFLIMEGMRNMKNMGLVTILNAAKVNLYKVNSSSIGYSIGPLLNGVARMENIQLAIHILLEDEPRACQKLRRAMSALNDERKIKQKQLTDQYKTKVNQKDKILIVIDEQSSKGFNGMIAQQLAEAYKRPVIVARQHEGTISGSYRGYGDFPIQGFLKEFGNVKTMGHPSAGGIEFKEELLPALQEYIEAHMPEREFDEPTVEYDFEINVRDVSKYIKTIERFNMLTGKGFEKIVVKVNGLSVDDIETLGATKETRKVKTFEGLELIKFRTNEEYGSELEVFDNISVVGTLNINEWYNFQTKEKTIKNQLILEDYVVRS